MIHWAHQTWHQKPVNCQWIWMFLSQFLQNKWTIFVQNICLSFFAILHPFVPIVKAISTPLKSKTCKTFRAPWSLPEAFALGAPRGGDIHWAAQDGNVRALRDFLSVAPERVDERDPTGSGRRPQTNGVNFLFRVVKGGRCQKHKTWYDVIAQMDSARKMWCHQNFFGHYTPLDPWDLEPDFRPGYLHFGHIVFTGLISSLNIFYLL